MENTSSSPAKKAKAKTAKAPAVKTAKASGPRSFTASNGEAVTIPRDVKILTITEHTLADGKEPGKQVHHRCTIVFENGITTQVKDTLDDILNA